MKSLVIVALMATAAETHRRLRAILTEAQVAQYDVLRGYASGSGRSGHKH